jgi:hypothetical protein
LPAATFRRLKSLAAGRGITLKQLLRSAVEREILAATERPARRRITVPVLKSKELGSLNLTNSEIDDFLAGG